MLRRTFLMHHSKGFLDLVNATRPLVVEKTVTDLQERLSKDKNVAVVDVREDREWVAGHLKGAIHIGRGVLERDIEGLCPDRSTEVVLYCGGGSRSVLAAKSLADMGYTNVSSLAGGWRAIQEAQLPIETSSAK